MRLKYLVILLLVVLLAFTVVKMMDFESSIRSERKVTVFIEDDAKPLFTKLPEKELREAGRNAEFRFTAGGDYFRRELTRYEGGEKRRVQEEIFLKGVNLGVAVPGKFPGEFTASFDQYLEWIRLIGRMNANLIRTYTILPPEFYQALLVYNFNHSDRPVYLMQGVWAEVPASENYFDPGFSRDFQKEIIDVIDVIHGRAVIKERPGRASGIFAANVSDFVAGILLGREWEPGSVFKTNQENREIRQYRGDFICMNKGNAMEAWLAGMMDAAVLYETQTYLTQHPVSFVNWLPLDPMFHSTEFIENRKVREYDNDLESIDFTRFHPTEIFSPGIFAAYHAYPYYPDFIYLQPSYVSVTGAGGRPDPYLGYLEDLKEHVPGMPLVIAEYGIPSSRGNSHYSPFGMHQGGHSEEDQARLSLSLTEDIVKAGCAGAVYFEWIDEWFKQNWLVMDFEQPSDDRRLWHNMENPEQNFGIMAMEDRRRTIDGELGDWPEAVVNEGAIMTGADATYFYLALKVPGADLDRYSIYVAIDTYGKEKGDKRLPFAEGPFANGFEFLLQFAGPDSAFILVDEPYSVFTDIYNEMIPGYTSRPNQNGVFIRQRMLTNRGRVSITGVKTDSVVVDRSRLTYGRSSDAATSNADWYFNREKGIVEIRLAWHLLNVTDPAKHFVLDNKPGTPEMEYTFTEGFNLFLFITDKTGRVVNKYPDSEPFSATWEGWDTPVYTQRLKPVYYTLREYFGNITVPRTTLFSDTETAETFSITEFMDGRKKAVSISFNNAGYSQYALGLPVLIKYNISATFGVDPEFLEDSPGIVPRDDDGSMKRLGLSEVRELAPRNEIALQPWSPASATTGAVKALGSRTRSNILTTHFGNGMNTNAVQGSVIFSRSSPSGAAFRSSGNGVAYTAVNAGMPVTALDSLLSGLKDPWVILVFHHLYGQPGEFPRQKVSETADRLFMTRDEFEMKVRLLRNKGYWIAPEKDVFRYVKERETSGIRTDRFENMVFLKIVHPLDRTVFDLPLTIKYKTNARILRIEGSEDDGTYENRTGYILFNVKPGHEVKIEIIE